MRTDTNKGILQVYQPLLATEDGRHHKYFLVYIMRCREHKRQIKPTKADMKAAGRRLPDIVGNWENKVSVFSKEKNVLG